MPLNIVDNGHDNVVECADADPDTVNATVNGDGNRLQIGSNPSVADTHLQFGSRCKMAIGDDCVFHGLFAYLLADSSIRIGNGVSFSARVRLLLHEPSSITVGGGSLFASDVDVTTSDMHSILSVHTGRRINPARDVHVGDNVWIGQRALILKGAVIGPDTVIAAGSVVSGSTPANVIAAGVPARVVRAGTRWDRALIDSASGSRPADRAEELGRGKIIDTQQRVLIAVPFYKAEALVAPLIQSLLACRGDLTATGSRVVFYNDSPGYEPLQDTLASILPTIAGAFSCTLHENPENLGFIRTMNQAVAEAVESRSDLLMLNSDAHMEPGALTEMMRVASLDPTAVFVNPRSDNATIATLPVNECAGVQTREGLRDAMQALAAKLPPASYVPTAIGFCLLIRWKILAEFGGFDEIYGAGYNEENDLIMRAARCGYRAVLANHALVWHEGEASFKTSSVARKAWETKNRAILDARYPEYGRHTAAFLDSPEPLAERLLACLLPDQDGLLDLALDFSSFRADHNGTFQAGRQILQAAQEVWGRRFRTFVICSEEVYLFHNYAELGIPRIDPHAGRRFAAVFRIGQPYDWNAIERLTTGGAVIGLYMLDTISVDCPQLCSPALRHLWQFALNQADVIVTQSRQTQHLLAQRFRIPDNAVSVMARHSLDLRDYQLPQRAEGAAPAAGGILVVGNHFPHKYVAPTANALTKAFPDRRIVVLGLALKPVPDDAGADLPPSLRAAPNLTAYEAGTQEQQTIDMLYHQAGLVVFPSHAEGFGFPVLTSLAAQKPVFVRRLPVFEELWEQFGHTANMHFFDSTADLLRQLQHMPSWIGGTISTDADADAAGSARRIIAGFEQALERAEYHRIVGRLQAVQAASVLAKPDRAAPPGETPPEAAARLLAERTQKVAGRVLAIRPVFGTTRLAVKSGRRMARLGRRLARLLRS